MRFDSFELLALESLALASLEPESLELESVELPLSVLPLDVELSLLLLLELDPLPIMTAVQPPKPPRRVVNDVAFSCKARIRTSSSIVVHSEQTHALRAIRSRTSARAVGHLHHHR